MNTSKFPSRKWLAVAFILATVFCLQNCTETPADKQSNAVGNTLRIRIEGAVPSLNPYLPSTSYSGFVAGQIMQTLGFLDPQTLELEPLLVKAIPKARIVTEGPYKGCQAFDFEINELATWDNGTPITAADVIFTMKIIFNPPLPTVRYRSYCEFLKEIETDPANPKKFTAYFSKYYILAVETMCQVPIFPAYNYDPNNLMTNIPLKDLVDQKKAEQMAKQANSPLQAFATEFQLPKYGNDKNFVVGSGPYRLESLDGQQSIVLVKKANWWGDKAREGNPNLAAYPDKLEYKVLPDENAAINLLRSGDLDLALTISPVRFNELKKETSLTEKYNFSVSGMLAYNRMLLNLKNPKLSDKRVRQALAHLMDYDYMLNTVAAGLGQRTVGPVNPAKSFYAKNIIPYDFNLQKTKDLLADAGWKDSDGNGVLDKVINGKKTELTLDVLLGTGSKVIEQISALIVETGAKAGIKFNLMPTVLNLITEKTVSGQYETALMGVGQFPGLYDFHQYYHSKSLAPAGDNRSRFINAEADKVFDALRTTENEAARNELYLRAQEILHEEVPEIFLFAPMQRYVVSKRFEPVLTVNRPGFYEQFFKLKK